MIQLENGNILVKARKRNFDLYSKDRKLIKKDLLKIKPFHPRYEKEPQYQIFLKNHYILNNDEDKKVAIVTPYPYKEEILFSSNTKREVKTKLFRDSNHFIVYECDDFNIQMRMMNKKNSIVNRNPKINISDTIIIFDMNFNKIIELSKETKRILKQIFKNRTYYFYNNIDFFSFKNNKIYIEITTDIDNSIIDQMTPPPYKDTIKTIKFITLDVVSNEVGEEVLARRKERDIRNIESIDILAERSNLKMLIDLEKKIFYIFETEKPRIYPAPYRSNNTLIIKDDGIYFFLAKEKRIFKAKSKENIIINGVADIEYLKHKNTLLIAINELIEVEIEKP